MRAVLLSGVICVAMTMVAQAQTARGRYIVEQVGMCGDCHTPRDTKGELVTAEALHGAPIGFRPLHPMPFAEHAPPLAGLPHNWTAAQTAIFLQTGQRPDGSHPLPPMPPYRMSKEDAWAVVDYLKSIP